MMQYLLELSAQHKCGLEFPNAKMSTLTIGNFWLIANVE